MSSDFPFVALDWAETRAARQLCPVGLSRGTRLGVGEVTAQIGAGGMGDVYRATDSNLTRSVLSATLPPGGSRPQAKGPGTAKSPVNAVPYAA